MKSFTTNFYFFANFLAGLINFTDSWRNFIQLILLLLSLLSSITISLMNLILLYFVIIRYICWVWILTLWARRVTGSGTGGCRGWSPLPCKKLNELSENVSFDSELALSFAIQTFKAACFIFLQMPLFQSIPSLNGLSKSIALVQKWKNAVSLKFLLTSKRNRQKRANSKVLLAHN